MKKTMSDTEPLSLMISSRCDDPVEFEGRRQPMRAVREALKMKLEKLRLGGRPVFRVWIHEDESNISADSDTWEQCLQRSRNADVFLALYNGRAGWLGTDSPVRDGLGICHAELSAAYNKAPAKVRSIQFAPAVRADTGSPDERFQEYFRRLKIPGAQVAKGDEALQRAEDLAAAVVLSLAREGIGLNSSGSFYAGEALEWTRMNFQMRRQVTTATVVDLLRHRAGRRVPSLAKNVVVVEMRERLIGFVCDCIPASMSTPAARELVGQPFLRDHLLTADWESGIAGPVHLIACQKGVTETQALHQLGFPDAVVVAAPFGVYVADDAQQIQMAFIANCRDETTTRTGVQTFLNWLHDHGEAEHLARRAQCRRELCDLMRRFTTGIRSQKKA